MKFFTLVLLLSAPSLIAMQSTAKKHRPERTRQEKMALLDQTLKTIHRTLLHTFEERQERLVNEIHLAGLIDESFKALIDESADRTIAQNVKHKRRLAQKYDKLLSDALKLALSLKEQSDILYEASLTFNQHSEPYQDAILANLTQLNSLYNALAPLKDYIAPTAGHANEPMDKATLFRQTMQDALEKIVVVRHTVL